MSRREEIEGYAPLLDDMETWKLGTPSKDLFKPKPTDKRSKQNGSSQNSMGARNGRVVRSK